MVKGVSSEMRASWPQALQNKMNGNIPATKRIRNIFLSSRKQSSLAKNFAVGFYPARDEPGWLLFALVKKIFAKELLGKRVAKKVFSKILVKTVARLFESRYCPP
jgi:hypothetical protein